MFTVRATVITLWLAYKFGVVNTDIILNLAYYSSVLRTTAMLDMVAEIGKISIDYPAKEFIIIGLILAS
ncbi:hypothetical protein MASR2M64_17970 [Candidatus Cloacimonadota bacterium]